MAYEPVWSADPEKLSKFEFVKLQKDGLDIIRTIIEKYALEGFDSIPADELDLFKWRGLSAKAAKRPFHDACPHQYRNYDLGTGESHCRDRPIVRAWAD